MHAETFNPIIEQFDTVPSLRPGTCVVEVKNGEASQSQTDTISLSERLKPLITRPILIGIVVCTTLIVFLVGFVGLLIAILSAAAGAVALLKNRRSPVAKSILGEIPVYYLVDVSPHGIVDERRVQLKDTGIYANVNVEYRATVQDAALVVESGITDVRAYLSTRLARDISQIAYNGILDDKLDGLRQELNQYASQPFEDDAIRVEQMLIDIAVDGDEAEELRRLSAASLQKQGLIVKHELGDLERSKYQELLVNDDQLIAEMMRPGVDRERLQGALRERVSSADIRFGRNLSVLEAALKHGIIEPHQIKRDYPQFFDELRGVMGNLSGAADGADVRQLSDSSEEVQNAITHTENGENGSLKD